MSTQTADPSQLALQPLKPEAETSPDEVKAQRKALLTRVRLKIARWLHLQPLTLLWLVVFGGSLLGLRLLAGPRLDLVVMIMGYVGLALCVLSLVAVVPAAIILARILKGKTGSSKLSNHDAGVPVQTGLLLPNFWWLPLLSIEWTWTSPSNVLVTHRAKGWRKAEEVTFQERGRFHELVREFTVSDVLGLARIRWSHRTPETITILPNPGGLRRMPVLQSFQSGDQIPHPSGKAEGDRHEIRRYTHGQSSRHILWKIFGRTRRLMVRQPERAIARSTNTAAYLIAAPGDEPSAAAARVAIESDALGAEWLFAADGAASETTRRPQALEAVAVSGAHRDIQGAGLHSFIEGANHKGFNRCLVFAPGQKSPGWLPRVTTAAAQWPGQVEVIIGIDGFTQARKQPWWRRWFSGLVELDEPQENLAEDLEETVTTLTRAGIRTLVLDRFGGRPVPLAMIRAGRTRK